MIQDRFFTQTHCDRCYKEIDSGRTMSMFNTQCICMACAAKEAKDPEYKKAVEADHNEIKKGNFNFEGIRGGKRNE